MAFTSIIGSLGKDPELKSSRDGKTQFLKFGMAWSERQRQQDGSYHDGPTVWVQVTVFGRQAQNLAHSLQKGDRVVVTGKLAPESWSSQQGEQTVMAMVAETVAPELTFATAQVVKNPKGGGQQGGGFQQQSQQQSRGGFGGQQAPDNDPWNSAPQGGFGGDSDTPPF